MSGFDAPGPSPLRRMDGEPLFDAPWQAQVLAMADALIEAGVIAPTAWSGTLGAELRAAAARREPDNADTYYASALRALEQVSETHAGMPAQSVNERRDAWAEAYRATPHGEPVRLVDT